jgi:selenoprotein W-related protein
MADAEVGIEYCVPCGLLPAAERTVHALLSRYGQRLAGVRLTPGQGGVFRVRVGEHTVFDRGSGEGFDLDVIVERVGERLPASSVLHL